MLAERASRKLGVFTLATRSRSRIEPNLRLISRENGNIAEDAQRFSARRAEDLSNSGHGDSPPEARSPLTAGFLATLKGISLETGLAGWGRRNRTAKFPFQNWPLKLRKNLGYSGQITGQRLSRDKVARIQGTSFFGRPQNAALESAAAIKNPCSPKAAPLQPTGCIPLSAQSNSVSAVTSQNSEHFLGQVLAVIHFARLPSHVAKGQLQISRCHGRNRRKDATRASITEDRLRATPRRRQKRLAA